MFGPYTEAAVQAFQAWFGLAIDGVAGALTWSALEQGIMTVKPSRLP